MTLPAQHAETLSSLITAVCDGLMLQWLLDPDRVPSSGQVMEALGSAVSILTASGDAQRGPAFRARSR